MAATPRAASQSPVWDKMIRLFLTSTCAIESKQNQIGSAMLLSIDASLALGQFPPHPRHKTISNEQSLTRLAKKT